MTMYSLLVQYFPLFMKGILTTIEIVVCCACISLSFGLLCGVLTCERLKNRFLSPILELVTFVLRAVPFYVQLLIVYFVFPDLLHLNLDAFTASVIGLGFCSAGYTTQIVRCGINSIPVAQWEAALALGYNRIQTLRYIILPQMLRNVLPAFNNELEALLKSTAVLSSIGLLELTRVGMNIISREMQPLPVYCIVALFYVLLSLVVGFLTRRLEKKMLYVKA